MQFGMRAHDLGKMDFLEMTEKLKQMEIKNIQLAFYKAIADIDFTVGNFSEGLCNHISTNLEKNDIKINVLGSYINPIHPDDTFIDKEVAKFKEYLKYGKLLNASVVGTETGSLLDWSDKGIENQYQRFLATMKRVKYDAERLGVFFAIEGVSKETMHSSKLIKRYFEEIDSPNALAIYDPANLIFAEEALNNEIGKNIDACFEDYGNKMAVVHLKDFAVENDENGKKIKVSRRIGEGVMDFERILYHLKRNKPYITCLLEESTEERYFGDIEYLKKLYSKI